MKQAFTLVELLVVVLIIGVLTSIAIPMYQGAVDKSHWSTMLPAAKAIKDAEEAIKMTNGEYTSQMDDLDVTMNNENLTFTLTTPNNMSDPNVIRVTNPKLANVRLASYLDDSPKFAGQLHCEAKDERSTRLCEKLLGGQELTNVDGYTGYLLDQAIDKATCDNASRSWSTTKTTCYKSDEARCTALEMNVIGQGQCGYENTQGKTIGAEGVCLGSTGMYACAGSIVSNGGKCIGSADEACYGIKLQKNGICIAKDGSDDSCAKSDISEAEVFCKGGWLCGWLSSFDNGSVCVGNGGGHACYAANFKNGSICYANVSGACSGYSSDRSVYYDNTSCCCGAYCGNAPSCASRGKTCDPYYMDPNNFKDL